MREIFEKYPSIPNVYARDPENHKLIRGKYSTPELSTLSHCYWHFTEKIDGMNIRVMVNHNEIQIYGRSDRTQLTPGVIAACLTPFQGKDDLLDKATRKGPLCFRGEAFGPKIQKGGCYGKEQQFRLFDIQTIHGYFNRRELVDMAEDLDLPLVPDRLYCTLPQAIERVSKGMKSSFGDFFAEGVVGRPEVMLLDEYGQRIQTKIKHRDFYKGAK